MNIFRLSLCICCLSLFCISWNEIETGEEEDKETKAECEKYAHEIYNTFAEEALKNLGLYCTRTEGASTRQYGPRKIENMEVTCSVPKALTIRDARKLEVQAAELLLDVINKHEKFRPFLKEHPCSVMDRLKLPDDAGPIPVWGRAFPGNPANFRSFVQFGHL